MSTMGRKVQKKISFVLEFEAMKGGNRLKKAEEGFSYYVKDGNPERLGVTKTGRDVNFAVAVPDRKSCSLLLYRKGSSEVEASIPLATRSRYGDIRAVCIEKFPAEQYEYNYRIDGEVVPDPYGACFRGGETWGQAREKKDMRSRFCFERFSWEGDAPPELPYEQCVMYSAHVRGFTMHSSSRVRHKGTFRGVEEKIPYLKELGVNLLELMPVYEFEEIPCEREPVVLGADQFKRQEQRMNYWGYGPGCYFAPKASYAASDNPVRELKHLVKTLHQNGIELVLEFYFAPETSPRLIVDCIKYWVMEYHIDGIHMNGVWAPLMLLAREPMLSHVKLMSESFPVDEIYPRGYRPLFRNLAEYHDRFLITARRLLKGDEGQLMEFANLVRRKPERQGVINYISSHNGFTLADLVSYDEKHNEANGEGNLDGTSYNYSWNCGEEGPTNSRKIRRLRLRQSKNALLTVLLSQGTPFLYSGDEMGNSQQGNNNVYCQDNELGWVSWNNGKAGRMLQDFTKRMIAFRRSHPIFRQPEQLRVMDYLSCGCPDLSYHGNRAWYGGFENPNRHLGMMYAADYVSAGSEGTLSDDYFYVAYNFHGISHEFALPRLPGNRKWHVAVNTAVEEQDGIFEEGQEELLEEQKTMVVTEHTIVVLIGK